MNLKDYKLWTALVTPLMPSGQVDFESLKNLISEQVNAKNGLLILGSTGEALNLDLETRKSIVDFTLEQKPTVPVMIGVGGQELAAQKSWVAWLETKNIQAYLMVNPIYAKANDEGQYRWFKELMDSVTRPVMLYNVPSRAGSWLSLKAVEKLRNHPNFWAIKEAGGSVERFKEYLCATNNGSVFCGDDGLMDDFARAGSCGLVSVASNTWPVATHLYVDQCLSNKLQDKDMWVESANSLFCASNPIPAKALLASLGRINHNTMMAPLYEGDLRDMSLLLRSNENIENWLRNNK